MKRGAVGRLTEAVNRQYRVRGEPATITRSYMGMILNGKRRPRWELAVVLRRILKVDADVVMGKRPLPLIRAVERWDAGGPILENRSRVAGGKPCPVCGMAGGVGR